MRILVVNCGSSSLKLGVFDIADATKEIFKASYEKFADGACIYKTESTGRKDEGRAPFADIAAALAAIPDVLKTHGIEAIEAVGHRVVHGGEKFRVTTVLDDAVVAEIETLTPLAPLHNPANLLGIDIARKVWPGLTQVAVFDTAFHLTNPARATTYAVPAKWRAAGLRRFGFHGTSHKYVAGRAAEEIGAPLQNLQIVSVHLGNGASVCAVNRVRAWTVPWG